MSTNKKRAAQTLLNLRAAKKPKAPTTFRITAPGNKSFAMSNSNSNRDVQEFLKSKKRTEQQQLRNAKEQLRKRNEKKRGAKALNNLLNAWVNTPNRKLALILNNFVRIKKTRPVFKNLLYGNSYRQKQRKPAITRHRNDYM